VSTASIIRDRTNGERLKRAVHVIEIAPSGGSANGSGLGVPPRRPGARASSNYAAVTDDR